MDTSPFANRDIYDRSAPTSDAESDFSGPVWQSLSV